MAKIVAGTEMVPPSLRDRPEAVFALALYAEAVGIHPALAWQQVSFIQGKPVPSAELQRSLILAAGHRLDVVEMSNERATVRGVRTDGSELTVTFSLDDAKRAGLLDKSGNSWRHYPASMCLARATSQLARALFPDAIGGMSYLAEELGGNPTPTGPPGGLRPVPDDEADRAAADAAHADDLELVLEDADVVDPDADDALNPDDLDDPGRPF